MDAYGPQTRSASEFETPTGGISPSRLVPKMFNVTMAIDDANVLLAGVKALAVQANCPRAAFLGKWGI